METTNLQNVEEIRIELAPEEYMPEYEKQIKNLAKNLHIKGFRQGKVPTTYIKARFGQELLTELIREKIQKKVDEFFKGSENKYIHPILHVEDNLNFITEGKTYNILYKAHLRPSFEGVELIKLSEFEIPEVILNEATISRILDESLRSGKSEEKDTVPEEGDFAVYLKTTDEEENERLLFLNGILNSIEFPGLREFLTGKKTGETVELPLTDLGGGIFLALKKLSFYLPEDDPRFQLLSDTPVKVVISKIFRFEPISIESEEFLKRWGFKEPVSEEQIKETMFNYYQRNFGQIRRNFYVFFQLINKLIETFPDLIDSSFVKFYAEYLEKEHQEYIQKQGHVNDPALQWLLKRDTSFPYHYERLARYYLYRRLLFVLIAEKYPKYHVSNEEVDNVIKEEVRRSLESRQEGEQAISEDQVDLVTQVLKQQNPNLFEQTRFELMLNQIYQLVINELPHTIEKMPIEELNERYFAVAFQLRAPID